MAKKITGLVVGKDFRPPTGADPADWCYLTIAVTDTERETVRLDYRSVPKVGLGDIVRFTHRGKHRRHRVKRVGSAPDSLPAITSAREPSVD